MSAVVYRHTIQAGDPTTLSDALAVLSGLSKSRVKKAMNLGAAWRQRGGAPPRRVRRASTELKPGDTIVLYYDAGILDRHPPVARCLRDLRRYSIWLKPAGLMTQGSRFGDFCALTRQVELHFTPRRAVFPVHRLDREVTGLLLIAHDHPTAGRLSAMLRAGRIEKRYMVWVRGNLYQQQDPGVIAIPFDDRPAITHYDIIRYDAQTDTSQAAVTIATGRRHQIRRHFDLIGHPVMGDPRYGSGNKNRAGLQLIAYELAFDCPLGSGRVVAGIDPHGPAGS